MVKEEGGGQQQTEDIGISKFELQYGCTVLKFYPIHHALVYNIVHVM